MSANKEMKSGEVQKIATQVLSVRERKLQEAKAVINARISQLAFHMTDLSLALRATHNMGVEIPATEVDKAAEHLPKDFVRFLRDGFVDHRNELLLVERNVQNGSEIVFMVGDKGRVRSDKNWALRGVEVSIKNENLLSVDYQKAGGGGKLWLFPREDDIQTQHEFLKGFEQIVDFAQNQYRRAGEAEIGLPLKRTKSRLGGVGAN